MTAPTMTTARPPRPRRPSPELVERALAAGVVALELLADVSLTAEGDLLITNTGRLVFIQVPEDNPDGAGRTGVMVFYHPKGMTLPYTPNFTPRRREGASEAWTLADFDWCAAHLQVPSIGVMQVDGFGGYRQWLMTGDSSTQGERPAGPWYPPVAAYALWRQIARRRFDGDLRIAARDADIATACRREVHACGWLALDELAKLP